MFACKDILKTKEGNVCLFQSLYAINMKSTTIHSGNVDVLLVSSSSWVNASKYLNVLFSRTGMGLAAYANQAIL